MWDGQEMEKKVQSGRGTHRGRSSAVLQKACSVQSLQKGTVGLLLVRQHLHGRCSSATDDGGLGQRVDETMRELGDRVSLRRPIQCPKAIQRLC